MIVGTPFETLEVPDVMKRTYPAIYNPADIPSVNPHIQVRNNAGGSSSSASSASSSSSAGISNTTDPQPVVEVDKNRIAKDANVTVSVTEADKKKRRITPMLVESGSSAVSESTEAPAAMDVAEAENVAVATTSSVPEAVADAVTVKTKKRIAPTMVSSVSSSSSSSMAPGAGSSSDQPVVIDLE
jgi:hypothetical protein